MNAARMFFGRISPSVYIITAYLSFFIAGFIFTIFLREQNVFTNVSCFSRLRFYEIHLDNSWLEARGVYHHLSVSGSEGKTGYVGMIFYHDQMGVLTKTVKVNREIGWRLTWEKSRLKSEVTFNHKRLGDLSDNQIIEKYIFPINQVGQNSHDSVFILNDKVMASGPEDIPRILCDLR